MTCWGLNDIIDCSCQPGHEAVEKQDRDKPVAGQPPSARAAAGWLSSYVLLSLIGLILLDCGSRLFYHPDPFDSPNRSWAWWATRSWRNQPQPPDVALLGSSLMFAVINDTDANYTNSPIDAVLHYRSLYLESLLSNKLERKISTASFAIGGEMASDAYALASALFKEKKPSLIVWGIAPRDFVDSCFGKADSSEIVRYMEKVSGNRVLDRLHTAPAMDTFLSGYLHILNHKSDITCGINRLSRASLAAIGVDDLDHKHAPAPLLKMAATELPDDNAPAEWVTRPRLLATKSNGMTEMAAGSVEERTREYEMRYRPFKQKTFDEQLHYFDKFLALAAERGIPVMLVNMPLTEGNIRILPAGVYDNYLSCISRSARNHGAMLLDLNEAGLFTLSQFSDPVHLNGRGGARLLNMVADRIETEALLKGVRSKGQIAGTGAAAH